MVFISHQEDCEQINGIGIDEKSRRKVCKRSCGQQCSVETDAEIANTRVLLSSLRYAADPQAVEAEKMNTMRMIISIAVLLMTSQVMAAVSHMSAKLEKLRQTIESNPTDSAKKNISRHFHELVPDVRESS